MTVFLNGLTRALATAALAMAVLSSGLSAQTLSRYRNFDLGSDVASIHKLIGGAGEATAITLHQRPALLQDLEWRPSHWVAGAAAQSTDPVDHVVFSFYDNQLFRVIVDYKAERTEGLTDTDMTAALSEVYGNAVKRVPGPARIPSQVEVQSGSPVGRWGDATYSIVLYRTVSSRDTLRLIVLETAVAERARKAADQAVRLDEMEAPRRELDRLKKEKADGLAAAETARAANKVVFKP